MMSENIINYQPLGNKRKRALSEPLPFNGNDTSASHRAIKRAKTESETGVDEPVRRMSRKTRVIAIAALKKSFKGFAYTIESRISKKSKVISATPSNPTPHKTGFAAFAATSSSPFGSLTSARGTSFLGLSGKTSPFGSPCLFGSPSTLGKAPSTFGTPNAIFSSSLPSTVGGTSFLGLKNTSKLGGQGGLPAMFQPGAFAKAQKKRLEAEKKRLEQKAAAERLEQERIDNSPEEKLRKAIIAQSDAKAALERHLQKPKEPGLNRDRRALKEEMEKLLRDTLAFRNDDVDYWREEIELDAGYVNYLKEAGAEAEDDDPSYDEKPKKNGMAGVEEGAEHKQEVEEKEQEDEAPKTKGNPRSGSTSSLYLAATPKQKRKREDEDTVEEERPNKKVHVTQDIEAGPSQTLPVSSSDLSALAVQTPKMATLNAILS